MTTAIPSSVFAEIAQIKSSPGGIAALLNEAEEKYSSTPLHFNAKRRYPYWKICRACSRPFPCRTKEQVARNRWCSMACIQRKPKAKKPLSERKGRLVACSVCGKKTWKPDAWLKRVKTPTCSYECNGVLRGEAWGRHAHKGRAAWTEKSHRSYREKMSGANNPAWKGGVTYFRKKGNYKPIKYVRCPQELLAMARKDGYVMEHRLIVARRLGRSLLRTEVVHHMDHNTANNTLSNLMLFASNRDHKLFESRGTPAPLWSGLSL